MGGRPCRRRERCSVAAEAAIDAVVVQPGPLHPLAGGVSVRQTTRSVAGTQNIVCYFGRMDRFLVPAAASIVVGLLLGAAAIFGVTLMVQQDTKPRCRRAIRRRRCSTGSSTATEPSLRTASLSSDGNVPQPLSRRWLWVVAAAALVLTFAQSPGKISPDTKLDLTANPLRFLARAFNLWNSELPFGQAQNQAYGYLFPHGAFFLAGDMLGLPGWVTQRLWWALLLTIGFWGLLRVAEALGIGTPTSRVIAAAAFALSPRVLTTLGAISSETLPMMLAPWVLLPVILALRGAAGAATSGSGQVRADPGRAVGVGDRADGCGQRRRDPDRLPGSRDLVGVPPAEPAVAALHRVVGAVCGAGGALVGGRAVHAGPDQPAVPRLHRVLRRHHAVDVADRDAARHRRLDSVRRAERHRGRLVGDGVGRGVGDDVGRGCGHGRAGDAHDACPRQADRRSC